MRLEVRNERKLQGTVGVRKVQRWQKGRVMRMAGVWRTALAVERGWRRKEWGNSNEWAKE